jgi:uncharacterized protein YbjT (DUF2867 family)
MTGFGRIAIVAGATGLVGAALLARLCAGQDYARLVALTRRPPAAIDARLECRQARFDALDEVLGDLRGARPDMYCCLGTTIAKAGSQAAFRSVDFDAVVALARWAKTAQARRFLLVSAMGADARSRVFYNRVKGEAEDAVRRDGPASVVVLRPGLLDGPRAEFRLGERIGLALTRPLRGILPAALRPVHADDVAAAMVEAARAQSPKPVIPSAAIQGAASRIA